MAGGTSTAPLPSGQPPLPQGAPPQPAPGETPTAPPAAALDSADAPLELKMGSSGDMVMDLQRELRRRGIKIRVDGKFGRSTRAGVRIMQRRMKAKATGRADAKFLRRLGIQVRAVASTPAGLVAPTGGARYLRVFPVQGEHTYFNDWGAPRGSRSHQGNDVMADKGAPVVAVADGTIKRLTREPTGLGGIWIWLLDTEGNEYYYAHLDSIVPLLEAGTAVAAGQVIGAVGNTGDAAYGADHLHFEIHPGGGGAVNPFTELISVDPNPPKAR